MQVKEIMEAHVETATSEQTLVLVAKKMRDARIGSLPVVENERLVGIVTDRDIVVRCVAEGADPTSTSVRNAMSADIAHCHEDQSLEDAAKIMAAARIRRLPVIDGEHHLVGIVALGDLALHGAVADTGDALREISKPTNTASDL